MADEPDLAKEVREASEAVAKAARTRSADDAAKAADESMDVVRIGLVRGWTWQAWLSAVAAIGLLACGAFYVGSRTETPVAERKVEPVKGKVGDEADIAKLLTDGFAKLDSSITLLGKKIDEKPVPPPVDPDKPKPPPVVTGITLPSTVNISEGHVTIKAVSAGPVTWFIPEYGNLSIDKFVDSIVVSARAGANGTYWIGATAVVDGKIVPPVYCAITVNQSPQPPPKPDPTPDPKPPTPKVDSLSLVAIYESSDTNSKTAKVVADYVFWESLKPLGVKWFKIDKDQKDANGSSLVDSHNYRQYVDKHGLPCLLFMDSAGLVVRAIPLPDSTATVRANITQLMGK